MVQSDSSSALGTHLRYCWLMICANPMDQTCAARIIFYLECGRVLGFLGPNGAGKTTAIRILTTILEPDAGYFIVDGIRSTSPGVQAHRKQNHSEQPTSKSGVKSGFSRKPGFPGISPESSIDLLRSALWTINRRSQNPCSGLLDEIGMQHRAKS